MVQIDTSKITRFEVIDIELGRVFVVPAGYASLTLSVQDEGGTLKLFLKRKTSDEVSSVRHRSGQP
jgi:hypothetical protein